MPMVKSAFIDFVRSVVNGDADDEVSVGTELHVVQSFIPEMILVEACYLGWQESLKLLALLVVAEIPDE